MSNVVEVRCPVGPKKLFTKLKLGEEFARYLTDTNAIEFSCWDCSTSLSRQRGETVRVFHCFNFIGELIETTFEQHPICGTALPRTDRSR